MCCRVGTATPRHRHRSRLGQGNRASLSINDMPDSTGIGNGTQIRLLSDWGQTKLVEETESCAIDDLCRTSDASQGGGTSPDQASRAFAVSYFAARDCGVVGGAFSFLLALS